MPHASPAKQLPTLLVIAALVFAAAAFVGVMARPAHGVQPATAQPGRVAVVRMAELQNSMQEAQAINTRNRARIEEINAEARQRAERIRELQENLRNLAPGSEQADQVYNELLNSNAELQIFQQVEQVKIQQQDGRDAMQLYRKMTAAIEEVARDRGYDVVLRAEPQLQAEAVQFTPESWAAIQSRPLVFHSENVDITQAVLAKLDADFAAGQ
jgi:Skp family chaperone for outer membrane proteins